MLRKATSEPFSHSPDRNIQHLKIAYLRLIFWTAECVNSIFRAMSTIMLAAQEDEREQMYLFKRKIGDHVVKQQTKKLDRAPSLITTNCLVFPLGVSVCIYAAQDVCAQAKVLFATLFAGVATNIESNLACIAEALALAVRVHEVDK